ncbi:MAG TPA: UbiD family decarboxylase [Rectinemataceae bacterium]|nr:UbiD family decarboxylase [Rectinemataceae bacterium]
MADITDLRSALNFLSRSDNSLLECSREVDPHAELAGVYRYIGAAGTVPRPTRRGPAMLFSNIKGFPDARIAIGLFGDRRRVGELLGIDPSRLGFRLRECVNAPIPPAEVPSDEAPCHEVVHRADEPGFDLRTLVPAPTNTALDGGPYITMGLCYATHPDTGASDVTIHRLCVQGQDSLSIFFTPGSRHIGAMAERASELGQPLPISISIGVDPAIPLASCFEPPTTPQGFDELGIAGALRGRAVELTPCITIAERAIAHAEYVIEGEIQPGVTVAEDASTGTGYAMPEFPGYLGEASPDCSVIKVKAVTHRRHPIMQTVIGPSEEHVNLVGIPTEASIIDLVERAMPGRLVNVYAHPSGGGKYLAILQIRKRVESDEGRQRQAALLAFSAFPELKHVILVDEDVDLFDTNDVLWALNTRYQGDIDTIFLPGLRCHPLDPTQSPEYSNRLRAEGTSCKTIFDCTVPFRLKERFKRASFMELDPADYVDGFRP